MTYLPIAEVALPSAVTQVAGGPMTGTVDDIRVISDGRSIHLEEAVTTPSFELQVEFASVPNLPRLLVVRGHYEGRLSHSVTLDIWNYVRALFEALHRFTSGGDYEAAVVPLPVDIRPYREGNAMRVRIIHNTTGNATHHFYLDYVGFWQ